jgi:RNA polymerase sigma factor (sigma-70 family)
LFHGEAVAGLPDAQLLERFGRGADDAAETAFAALVERHAPMVLRVCRQILGNAHDAEDAAQATFLVLARRAPSIATVDSLAGWLYGVASRVAVRAKVDAARRRRREQRSVERSVDGSVEGSESDPWPELHEELRQLPERFRMPIVLHHLEGLTYEQTAERLGCPVRTVQSRLARGRERLRSRLARRGVGPATGALIAGLVPTATEATVSPSWVRSIIDAAVPFAAAGTSATGVLTPAAVLAEGVLKAMSFKKLKSVTAVVVLAGLVACGIGALVHSEPPASTSFALAPQQHSDPYRVTMSNGTTIEVVAVAPGSSRTQSWWRPDGSILDKAPADPLKGDFSVDDNHVVRGILIRVTNLPEEATINWLPTYVTEFWGGRPTRNGRNAPELEYYMATFDRARPVCAIKARVATGPWKTEETHDGTGGYSRVKGPLKFYFGKARAYHGGTSIAVAQNIVGRDSRVVAIDRNGKVHKPNYSSGAGGEMLSLLDAEFGLPPDQIREYAVQSRPFESVEISCILLNPRAPAER